MESDSDDESNSSFEKWREYRREHSSHINRKATTEIQQKLAEITGLNMDIVQCDENICQPLWIDNMTDILLSHVCDLTKRNKHEELCNILLNIGFSKEYLEYHDAFREDYGEAMTWENIIENFLEAALEKIDSIYEIDERGFPAIFRNLPTNQWIEVDRIDLNQKIV